LEFRCYHVYKSRYTYFQIGSHYFGYLTSSYVGQYSQEYRWIPCPRKHGELRSRGMVNTPYALHFFQYRFTWEQTFFKIYLPKDVEVSSPEVYGSVFGKIARKKYGVLKNPSSLVRGLMVDLRKVLSESRLDDHSRNWF